MSELFGFPLPMIAGQILVGIINGALYAVLSLGLALIFGMLNVVNMAHGALFTLGAFTAWALLNYAGIGYWGALVLVPLIVGLFGIALEFLLIRRIYNVEHIYGLLLTLGIALCIEGLLRNAYGSTGVTYDVPKSLSGAWNLGFMFLPKYRAWVVIASLLASGAVWLVIEKTKVGAYLRAATENPPLIQAFGVNVPLMIMLTYGVGVGLAGLSGVLAAPIYSVSPQIGSNFIIIVFAIVVIGGMGSISGAIFAGFGLGVVEGIAKLVWPQASGSVIFIIMAIVLVARPAGLFGKATVSVNVGSVSAFSSELITRARGFTGGYRNSHLIGAAIIIGLLLAAPLFVYPVLLMKILCFALFALAFNLLIGNIGLLSFGHATFFGGAAYVSGYAVKAMGFTPELAIIAGGAFACAFGFLVGWLAVRRDGIYFAMITLALAQLAYFIFVQAPFTGGEDGIQMIPRGNLFGIVPLSSDITMYVFVSAIFLLGLLAVHRVTYSPAGLAMRAIRDNEQRAISIGYNNNRIKLAVFVLSATLSGIAGATKALVFGSATLIDASWATSGDVVLMTLIGGLGTLLGPIVGAAILVCMHNLLAGLGGWVTIAQGVIFIICVLTFRQGIVGAVQTMRRAISRTERIGCEEPKR